MKLLKKVKGSYMLVTERPDKMDADLYQKLYRLNFRNEGSMQNDLRLARLGRKTSRVYALLDESGRVCAWSHVIGNKPRTKEQKTDKEEGTYREVHFYTRATERGKGLAKIIAKQVIRDYGKYITHFPHDEKSTEFFKSAGFARSHTVW